MRFAIFAKSLAVCLTIVSITFAQSVKPETNNAEQDFGEKILAIVTQVKGGNNEVGGGYYEKCVIRKLGDQYFLVGKVVDVSESRSELVGKTVWTKVSDINTLTEFNNLNALKEALAKRE